MKINTNIPALLTHTNLLRADRRASLAMGRLSSGLQINSVKDDAAGMAIGNKMKLLTEGMAVANRNAMDGISIVQTADGALNEVHSMLQRLRELSVQSANDTNEPEDRDKMQLEADSLIKEINAVSDRTEFNNVKLLNGSLSSVGNGIGPHHLQIGANKGMELVIEIPDLSAKAIGLHGYDITTQDSTTKTIALMASAIEKVSAARANLGAYQNRLEAVILGLDSQISATQSARSRIMDADMAREMTAMTQANIISQAGIAILAQANQRPQQIIQLL